MCFFANRNVLDELCYTYNPEKKKRKKDTLSQQQGASALNVDNLFCTWTGRPVNIK